MSIEELFGVRAREIKEQKKTNLDDLLKLHEDIVKKNIDFSVDYEKIENSRNYLTDIVSKLNYNEEDLKSYVLTVCNSDYDNETWKKVGIFSGVLLSYLTQKRAQENKRCIIDIDFGWNNFNYLFYCAKYADKVVVRNLRGDSALRNVASNGGKANQIIGLNIKGDSALMWVASNGGKANQVIGMNIKGYGALGWIASDGGEANQVIGRNIEGERTMCLVAFRRGKANQVIGMNIKGDYALNWVADEGKANQVIGMNIEGEKTLCVVAFNGGKAKQVIIKDIKGKNLLKYYGKIEKIIREDDEATKIINEYKISKMVEIAEKLKNNSDSLDVDGILKAASEMYEIYKFNAELHKREGFVK